MDPLDHELKIIRHITRCTSMKDQRIVRSRSPEAKQGLLPPITNKLRPKHRVIPFLSQDNSVPSLISQSETSQRSKKPSENISSPGSSRVFFDATNVDIERRGRLGRERKTGGSNPIMKVDAESDMASTLSSLISEVKNRYSEKYKAFSAERRATGIKTNSLKEVSECLSTTLVSCRFFIKYHDSLLRCDLLHIVSYFVNSSSSAISNT
jgi:hypothetical protein